MLLFKFLAFYAAQLSANQEEALRVAKLALDIQLQRTLRNKYFLF
jgi:hypothetical protein